MVCMASGGVTGPPEDSLSLSVSDLPVPSLSSWVSLSSSPIQREEVLLAPTRSQGPGEKGGARDGGGASGRDGLARGGGGWSWGAAPAPPDRSQPGWLSCAARYWPRCCWDLASSPVAVLPERGVARGSGGPGNRPARAMLPSLTLVGALSVPWRASVWCHCRVPASLFCADIHPCFSREGPRSASPWSLLETQGLSLWWS